MGFLFLTMAANQITMNEKLGKVYNLILRGYKICTDSRSQVKNSIFFALKGDTFDGNIFAQSAIENGASLAVVDDEKLASSQNMVVVPNTLEFLQELAKHHRSKLKIPIIGLTGSNGKTTTKELIAQVLKKKFNTFFTQGNLNNHIGVPLSILSITKSHEIAIIEMGANHIGEIANLCSISQPTHGLITNIGMAHLEGFGSLEGVKTAKSELYQYLAKTNATVFVNSNNEVLLDLIKRHGNNEVVSYGTNDFKTTDVNQNKKTLSFTFYTKNRNFQVDSQLVGNYNIENILAALCVGDYLGVNIEEGIEAIKDYSPSNSRSQLFSTSKNEIILDAYNANPSSMELALKNFASLPTTSSKLVILGEMLELGEYAQDEHKRIAKLAQDLFHEVILIGKNFQYTASNTPWFLSTIDCSEFIEKNPIKGKTILVKGSRGVKLENLIGYL